MHMRIRRAVLYLLARRLVSVMRRPGDLKKDSIYRSSDPVNHSELVGISVVCRLACKFMKVRQSSRKTRTVLQVRITEFVS